MTVEPIMWEKGRFFVQSASRAEVVHVVDICYQEDPWVKSHSMCSCEDCFCRDHVCKHIFAVVAFELNRIQQR